MKMPNEETELYDGKSKPTARNFLTPGSFIDAARRADPNFRYAIVAAGILAIVVVFNNFGLSWAALLLGAIALLGLMVLYLVFVQIHTLQGAALDLPARVLVWTVLLAMVTVVTLMTTSAFFSFPLPIKDWLVREITPSPTSEPTSAPSELDSRSATGTEEANATAETQEPSKPIDEAAKALILTDIIDAYQHVGWQISFFNDWGQGPTRQLLRVENKNLVATTPDRRVTTSVDPDALPKPQYYGPGTIASLGSKDGPKVTAFFSAYDQYRAALIRLNNTPVDFLSEFNSTTATGNDVMKRGREALCALGQAPPVLFPAGGFSEPVPPNCEGID